MEELQATRGQELPAGDPQIFRHNSASELEQRARQIGSIAGQVVAMIRNARRYTERGGPVHDLRSRAAQKADEFREQASAWAEDWRQAAQEKSAEFRRRARVRYEEARYRTDQLAHDYPWHVLAAAGIAGFILGAALRVRRANHGL